MSRRQHLCHLRDATPAVLPSLLMCDFGNLEREVAKLEAARVAALHLDVMDGRFVPNLTYGMPIVKALRRLTQLPLDVHLMVESPERYFTQFRDAGADILTIHVEAVDDPAVALTRVRDLDMGAGITLNPQTPLAAIESCLSLADMVLIMSVEAGFGGQAFNQNALDRLRRVRQLAEPNVLLQVDGGINESTIRSCAESGAELFVVGSAIFGGNDYVAAINRLTAMARV